MQMLTVEEKIEQELKEFQSKHRFKFGNPAHIRLAQMQGRLVKLEKEKAKKIELAQTIKPISDEIKQLKRNILYTFKNYL